MPFAAAEACDDIGNAIEDERSRLMTAEALLHCIVTAMGENEGDDAHGPDYQTLVGLARDLVKESIDRLDSMRLRALFEDLRRAGYEVKEEASTYVH